MSDQVKAHADTHDVDLHLAEILLGIIIVGLMVGIGLSISG